MFKHKHALYNYIHNFLLANEIKVNRMEDLTVSHNNPNYIYLNHKCFCFELKI